MTERRVPLLLFVQSYSFSLYWEPVLWVERWRHRPPRRQRLCERTPAPLIN
jgi:hypothetical protein